MRKKLKEEALVQTETKNNANSAEAPVFSKSQLCSNCFKLFGVTPSTFAAAAYGIENDVTVEKMRLIINKWNSMRALPHK